MLVDLQPDFYDHILSAGYELFAKKDLAFLQTVFKLLMREYGLRPPLQVEQFFNPGYFEPKVELVLCCIDLVRKQMKPKKNNHSAKNASNLPAQDFEENPQTAGPMPAYQISSNSQGLEEYGSTSFGNKPSPPKMYDGGSTQIPKGFGKGNSPKIPTLMQQQEEDDEYEDSRPHQAKETFPLAQGGPINHDDRFGVKGQPSPSAHFQKPSPDKSVFNLPKTPQDSKSTGLSPNTTDQRDAVIAAQRKTIEELKALVLLNVETVKDLSARLATHTVESAKKISSLEARITLLEAVHVIRGTVGPQDQEDEDYP